MPKVTAFTVALLLLDAGWSAPVLTDLKFVMSLRNDSYLVRSRQANLSACDKHVQGSCCITVAQQLWLASPTAKPIVHGR